MRLPSFTHPDYADDHFQRLLFQLAESLQYEILKQQDHWNVLDELQDAHFTAEEAIWGFTPLNLSLDPTIWPLRAAVPALDNVTIILHLRSLEDKFRFMAASMSLVAKSLHKAERPSKDVELYSNTLHTISDCLRERSVA